MVQTLLAINVCICPKHIKYIINQGLVLGLGKNRNSIICKSVISFIDKLLIICLFETPELADLQTISQRNYISPLFPPLAEKQTETIYILQKITNSAIVQNFPCMSLISQDNACIGPIGVSCS